MRMKEIIKIINDILKATLIIAIKFYKYLISPVLPNSCRYLPTCSDYALRAIKLHGILRGLKMSAWRVLRCHPWGGHGGHWHRGRKRHCRLLYLNQWFQFLPGLVEKDSQQSQ